MKRTGFTFTIIILILLFPITSIASSPATWNPSESIFSASAMLACNQRAISPCLLLQTSREELSRNLAYYRALIKVGAGEYDVIRVSRLVRESTPGIPVHTVGSFFFIHGSSETFNQVMVMPHHNEGMGVYLADRNIDVWGIDLRNVQIPSSVTDVSFASTWGFDVQIKDVLLATRTARWVRGFTRQGVGPIMLGGHSSGAALTYAVANSEAVLPQMKRDIAGIVSIDIVYKLPPDAVDQSALSCGVAEFYHSVASVGMFDNSAAIAWAQLAKTEPNGISPYDPARTNLQYVMENAGGTPFFPMYPWHPWAIVRDNSGVAVAGHYSATDEILNNYAASPFYPIPNAMDADMFSTSCSTIDSPYDDNLAQIKIPVLYIGAAGGFGRLGEYTTQLLGSDDVTRMMIQLLPNGHETDDFGHMDAFTAAQAPQLVWRPMQSWIVQHSH